LNFVFLKLSTPFNDGFKPPLHSSKHRTQAFSEKKERGSRSWTGTKKMARYEVLEAGLGTAGSGAQADILFEMGMMYATGRDCSVDLVAAHKWFNIAAIKGSDRAAELRAELSVTMSKQEIAQALREAREWMTMH
jgi:TPR repeat protein